MLIAGHTRPTDENLFVKAVENIIIDDEGLSETKIQKVVEAESFSRNYKYQMVGE